MSGSNDNYLNTVPEFLIRPPIEIGTGISTIFPVVVALASSENRSPPQSTQPAPPILPHQFEHCEIRLTIHWVMNDGGTPFPIYVRVNQFRANPHTIIDEDGREVTRFLAPFWIPKIERDGWFRLTATLHFKKNGAFEKGNTAHSPKIRVIEGIHPEFRATKYADEVYCIEENYETFGMTENQRREVIQFTNYYPPADDTKPLPLHIMLGELSDSVPST
ncbi:hypothetical protein GX51_07219 [Blastomyces parvus]|uniref:Uncharacterized protein n=1 Tax=Blastomyces parvus TaxID=2060905 RepID=A0A2B7WM04_9EURO|nr:hypothetical protein GX51_07219 [Blastomyces parvus]